MFEATIFDMDGVLIDSEPLWQEAEIAVLGPLGIPLTPARCLETRGLRIDEVVAYWFQRYPWHPWPDRGMDSVSAAILQRVGALIQARGQPLPGALAAVALARRNCAKLAVASSSPLGLIERVVAAFGISPLFDVLQSAEFEPRGKPHPAVYLAAAARLGVAPVSCLAIEDSIAGVTAAKAAGMTCIAIPEPRQRADGGFSMADAVLGSLVEFEEYAHRELGFA